jgi:hypothetical protein
MNGYHMSALAETRLASQRDEADRQRLVASPKASRDDSASYQPARLWRASLHAMLRRAVPRLETTR